VRVRASIEPRKLYLGDRAVLSISIEGDAGDVSTPRVPEVEGLTIKQAGSPSQSTRIINGRLVHKSLTYQYVVSAGAVGEYTIPATHVEVDGETLKTRALTFTVVEAPKGGPTRLLVEANKRTAWQFEPVDIVYTWAFRADINVASPDLNLPVLRMSDRMHMEVLVPPDSNTDKLVAGRVQLDAAVSRKRIDDTDYNAYTITLRLYPEQPGELVIPPASATTVVAVPTNKRDIWGDRVYDRKREFAAADGVTVTVNPLPAEGRPGGFNGPVGRFSVSTEISETRAYVDDPLRLTITVRGDGLLDRVQRPLLSANPVFVERFRFKDSLESGDVARHSVTFEQVIRPRTADVGEVPPVEFAYFDSDTGEYRVARSDPIPIQVLPASAQSIETFGDVLDSNAATELTRRPGGLYTNVTSYAALRDQIPRLAVLWVLVVPPAAYGILLALHRRRRRLRDDVALARASAAWRRWSKHLATLRHAARDDDGAFFDNLARTVSGYLSDKLNLGQGELTAGDVRTLVEEQRIPEDTGAQAIGILERCDAARFAPQQLSIDERRALLDEADAFGRRTERAIRRRR